VWEWEKIQKMLQGLKTAVLLLIPALASAAIFPDKIGAFEKGSPTAASIQDQGLFAEFGLETTEQAEYKSPEKKHFTATAWRFHDSTGAMAFFQAHRASGATAAPLAKLSSTTSDGIVYAYGNYVLQLTGAVPPQEDMAPVYAHLPKLEQSPLPALMTFLPAAGLIPNSERYLLGPASLDRFEPRITPSVAGFHLGAEGQIGKYSSPKGPLSLAIFAYPTPNMARERLAEFQKIPGAMAKRAGPLVVVTLDPPDLDAAERLLAQVKYEANLTISEKVPVNEVKGFAKIMVNTFVLAGIVGAMCIIAGFALGGYKVIARKLGRTVESESMITLHIDSK
jgi:hypothetical protein